MGVNSPESAQFYSKKEAKIEVEKWSYSKRERDTKENKQKYNLNHSNN